MLCEMASEGIGNDSLSFIPNGRKIKWRTGVWKVWGRMASAYLQHGSRWRCCRLELHQHFLLLKLHHWKHFCRHSHNSADWFLDFFPIFLIFENSILKQCTHLEPDFKTNLISLKIEHTCYCIPTNTGQKFPLFFNSFESLVMRSHCKSVTLNMVVSVFLFRHWCRIDSGVKGSWMLQNIVPGKCHF